MLRKYVFFLTGDFSPSDGKKRRDRSFIIRTSALYLLMIDHDRLFKELLSTFFLEFLELFVPDIAHLIDPNSIRFLPQEYFLDLTIGEEKIIDLLVEVKLAGEDMAVLIHVEAQASSRTHFNRRMFFYFALLHQKYLQRVYPIVVFSFDEPYREESNVYTVAFPNRTVLEFSFEAIQLNRLNWRDFLEQRNPVAAALMSKMRIHPAIAPKSRQNVCDYWPLYS
jgi:hypothetical protein